MKVNEMVDYIDITPVGVDGEGRGQAGKKNTIFQETEKEQIMLNPNGLTKEGVFEKIRIWKYSNNKHVQMKYATMLAQCKNLADSGKDKEGRIIFARDKTGNPRWVGEKPDKLIFKK